MRSLDNAGSISGNLRRMSSVSTSAPPLGTHVWMKLELLHSSWGEAQLPFMPCPFRTASTARWTHPAPIQLGLPCWSSSKLPLF